MAEPTATRSRLLFICIPRSGSTSMLKCLSFFDDSDVWFEPFYSCRIARIEYEKDTGKNLPTEWDDAHAWEFNHAASLIQAKNKIPLIEGKKYAYSEVKQAIESSTKSVVVVKDMATSFHDLFEYIPSVDSGFRYVFIIRDPRLAISSYKRAAFGWLTKEGSFTGCAKDFSLYRDDPYYQSPGGCYKSIYSIWQYARRRVEPEPLVIEMEDFLANPKPFLQKICKIGRLEYHDGLLEWDVSTDVIDTWKNPGGVTKMLANALGDFHQTAINSSGFCGQKSRREIPERSSLDPDVIEAVNEGMEYYNEMHEHRFNP